MSNDKSICIGVIGEYQSGKSLFINCILRRSIASVGSGNATTHTIVRYRYSFNERIEYIDVKGNHHTLSIERAGKIDTMGEILEADIYVSNENLKGIVLIDMPGFGANRQDNTLAKKALSNCHFAILMASNDKAIGTTSSTFQYLQFLKTYNIPYYFVLNCRDTDKWNCDDVTNINIMRADLNALDFYLPIRYPLNDDNINIINLMWYWYSICAKDDELINRAQIKIALTDYEINESVKGAVGEASNFRLINKIFDMENRGFLELMSEIKKLKDEVCPIGTIQAFAFNHVPDGWMVCDGQSLKVEDYPFLFDAIGYTFGMPKSGIYKVPDLRGKFIRGWDSEGKVDPQRKFGTNQEHSFQRHRHNGGVSMGETNVGGEHSHSFYMDEHGAGLGWIFDCLSTRDSYAGKDKHVRSSEYCNLAGAHTHSVRIKPEILDPIDSTSGKVHLSNETRPTNLALLFCIKYR